MTTIGEKLKNIDNAVKILKNRRDLEIQYKDELNQSKTYTFYQLDYETVQLVFVMLTACQIDYTFTLYQ